jgi:hypothetical protein
MPLVADYAGVFLSALGEAKAILTELEGGGVPNVPDLEELACIELRKAFTEFIVSFRAAGGRGLDEEEHQLLGQMRRALDIFDRKGLPFEALSKRMKILQERRARILDSSPEQLFR